MDSEDLFFPLLFPSSSLSSPPPRSFDSSCCGHKNRSNARKQKPRPSDSISRRRKGRRQAKKAGLPDRQKFKFLNILPKFLSWCRIPIPNLLLFIVKSCGNSASGQNSIFPSFPISPSVRLFFIKIAKPPLSILTRGQFKPEPNLLPVSRSRLFHLIFSRFHPPAFDGRRTMGRIGGNPDTRKWEALKSPKIKNSRFLANKFCYAKS